MKKISIFIICLFLFTGCFARETMNNIIDNEKYTTIMKQDIFSVMMAYPEYVTDIEVKDGNVYLVMKSGNKIIYDDKRQKGESEKLNNPDIQDMMEEIYPLSDIKQLLPQNVNPGRIRVYPLLKEVYGASKAEIESNIVNAKAGYKAYPFNSKNKAAQSLESAMKEASLLAQNVQNVRACLYPISGTFNYRYIAGTNRLSPHSFGIAIDLARDNRDYWKWATREQGQSRLDTYSREIVRIFEKNNFIWGGKWGYFDILHFEYRPELIIKSKYFNNVNHDKNWYSNVPINDETKKYIDLIESKIN
ncbi:M15 family metallopeptidase [Alkalithermobacter paradoxus]|uniref:Peptidase M15C domain-containing protein n=1 Tax=Alkalithermobacter paradoxus TaxID=29349 RepID=A0A1V4I773_9FIRM|nr:hypothetical protein CLOTH_14550 [[Clostridium] thermoalcaliphilum]